MKTLILREDQYKHIVDEMAYPTSFNMEVFKSLPSFNKRILYCQQHLTRLSAGSSRIVYQIDNEKVLKLAKNQKGIAQNNAENDGYLNSLDCFAKTYDSDENNLWIEMELAKKAKKSDFKRLTGYSFDVFCYWVEYVAERYGRSGYRRYNEYRQLFESEEWEHMLYNDVTIFSEIEDYMLNFQLNAYGDLQRISSWGVVNRNGREMLVLIDYGLNDEIAKEFYYMK